MPKGKTVFSLYQQPENPSTTRERLVLGIQMKELQIHSVHRVVHLAQSLDGFKGGGELLIFQSFLNLLLLCHFHLKLPSCLDFLCHESLCKFPLRPMWGSLLAWWFSYKSNTHHSLLNTGIPDLLLNVPWVTLPCCLLTSSLCFFVLLFFLPTQKETELFAISFCSLLMHSRFLFIQWVQTQTHGRFVCQSLSFVAETRDEFWSY